MVVQMVAVGERTGALDTMLSKVADFYDTEVEYAVVALTSVLEPALIMVMGGIVGFIVSGPSGPSNLLLNLVGNLSPLLLFVALGWLGFQVVSEAATWSEQPRESGAPAG